MTEPSSAPPPVPVRKFPFLPAVVLVAAIFACSIYANLAFAVTHQADYRYFPPFRPYVNVNANRHLGGEYFNMAQSLRAGEGFAHPFDRPTGPTAWQPPVLPLLLAGLLWACDDNRDAVMAVVVFLQVYVLIGTGLLVLALARQTTQRMGTAVVGRGLLRRAPLRFPALLPGHARLLAGVAGGGSADRRAVLVPAAAARANAFGWGLFGGLCALIKPDRRLRLGAAVAPARRSAAAPGPRSPSRCWSPGSP